MDYISLFFLGWFLGSMFTTIKIRRRLLNPLLEEFEKEKEKIPYYVIEQHGDTLYLFEKESDVFVCQGTSKEELVKKLADYKKIYIALVEYNSKFLWFVNGEIKDEVQFNES